MAPPKPPVKKPKKALEKPIEKPVMKSKTKKKKNYHNYAIYVFRLLRQVTQNRIGITRRSMAIMNNFVFDTLEEIATQAGRLVSQSKKNTMGTKDIQAAIKLVIPGELAKHANLEAVKAIAAYYNTMDTTKN